MPKYDINTLLEEAPYEKSKKKIDINELLQLESDVETDLTKPYVGYRKFRSQKATEQQQQLNPQDVVQGVKQFGQGLASLGDVTFGGIIPAVVGTGNYAVARALGATPESASQYQQFTTNLVDKPFGKAFGVTETPGYKNETSQQLMNFIGENVGKGADWISQQTGIPKQDVEHYLGLAGIATTPYLPKVANVVGQGAKIAGQSLKAIGTELQDVKGQLSQQFQKRQAQPPVQPQVQPTGMQSGGAAAVAHQQAVRQALAEARPDLQQTYANRPIETFTPEDLKAIQIHNKFAMVDPEFVPTEGQATQNIAKLSDEYNEKTHEGNEALRQKFEERDPFLIKGFNNVKDQFATEHSGVGQAGKANNVLEDVKKNRVDVDTANIKKAYQSLQTEDGKFAVDMKTASENALAKIEAEDRLDKLPKTIKDKLDKYINGAEGNLNRFENLRSDIESERRLAQRQGDGTTAHVLGLVRDAMEELPMKGDEAIAFKDKADIARTLFKNQKDLLDPKKPTFNKLYSMAFEDNRTPLEIETGNVQHPASKGFFENFIAGNKTTPADLSRAIELVGRDTPAHHEIIAGLTDYLKQKAGVIDDKGNVSQASLRKELNKIGTNLDLIAGPEVANRLRNIGDVAELSEHVRNRAGGSANVSQTGILTEGEAAKRAAKDVALGIGEAALNVKTGGASGVVGQVLKPIFKAKQERQLLEAQQAEKAKLLQQRIKPTAGISDIGTINIKGQ
jgi:hypothetical protein